MSERSELIENIRSEIVGPSRPAGDVPIISFDGLIFHESDKGWRTGSLGWIPSVGGPPEEVLYYDGETPHRKYGTGLLHPVGGSQAADQTAVEGADTLGVDSEPEEHEIAESIEGEEEFDSDGDIGSSDGGDDFEVTSIDTRHPSSMGISFCIKLAMNGKLVIRFPQTKRFVWQTDTSTPFPENGRYEKCTRFWIDDKGASKKSPMWRRSPAFEPDCAIAIDRKEFIQGRKIVRDIQSQKGSPLKCTVEVFPRLVKRDKDEIWLLTTVLRNVVEFDAIHEPREAILYQAYFEVSVENGVLEKYPESQRPFDQLDSDEKSLALLYRDSATWGIGHGCAAGWDTEPAQVPTSIYADVMPAVQTPSMTPDIKNAEGKPIELSMRLMTELSDNGIGPSWDALALLANEYSNWIDRKKAEGASLPFHFRETVSSHLEKCNACLTRIREGIQMLRDDARARTAFKLANLSMLLQQIGTKQLSKRPLKWNPNSKLVAPEGPYNSPWDVFEARKERNGLGSWRAFQIAFLLMSLKGTADGESVDREIVDLIWFPTGGGKTEAYLGVISFYLYHQRLLMEDDTADPKRDGTNVLMRYTLRMLTTQQFQRAASLICSMEYLRRYPQKHGHGVIPGKRFSLGLWIGSTAAPNKIAQAKTELALFRAGKSPGNPLVLTECPWCRAEIGRFEGERPTVVSKNDWNNVRTRGVISHQTEGPLLHCPDGTCAFGTESFKDWIPVEVIDERIYSYPPTLVIATADKFAMIAYRPDTGALFGRQFINGVPHQTHTPPGLIIQDELHLISGPLGTMYALYEGIIERLCSEQIGNAWIKPKIIASTATIRGAADQVKSLYARIKLQLYPSPGLSMSDSFFGTYARNAQGKLSEGRLYLGIHSSDYGSVLTTQVRVFSAALFRPYSFSREKRDPWWSLLVFYNSLRELGGAKTLFDSDIRSRLKFLFNREGFTKENRRNLRIVEELTSRLTQAEIVSMMEKLAADYLSHPQKVMDACLASSIIEVGVDIGRLSLMGVVGQPKTTAQYIQVTGRVGRKWWERPGLILMIYNPSKSRDRSHYEQFHSYHRRLYEKVEPTSATPFAISAIQRGMPGALIAWARQHSSAQVSNYSAYDKAVRVGYNLLLERSALIQNPEDQAETTAELERLLNELVSKWGRNPRHWEEFPPNVLGEYLMLWPGQYATVIQKSKGLLVGSSMRQVDGSAELTITQGYATLENPQGQP